jgi:hypothetical protein
MPADRTAASFQWSNNTTADFTGDTFILRVRRDKECWFVSEDGSCAYGTGRTLLEAMADLWSALYGLVDVVERHQPATARVDRQASIARQLLEVRDGD